MQQQQTNKDPIEEAVEHLWKAGIGINTLHQQVKQYIIEKQNDSTITKSTHDNNDNSNDNQEVDVVEEVINISEITKQKVKAAKLILPYKYNDNATILSEEKIVFIERKINQRQNLRKQRRYNDADYIQRGLDKMGVVLDDGMKTWSFPNKVDVEKNNDDDDVDEGKNKDFESNNNHNSKKNTIPCEMCGTLFESRNLIFKHLRDPGTTCGNSIFVLDQTLPDAPSAIKKSEKKTNKSGSNGSKSRTRDGSCSNVGNQACHSGGTESGFGVPRDRTGKTAQHADKTSSLWMGGIPLPWSRAGGKYKRFRAALRHYLPREIPKPWIKVVVRKGYRKRVEQTSNNEIGGDENIIDDCSNKNNDNANTMNGQRGEYQGYAIVVFRCEEEASMVCQAMDGIEIASNQIFGSEAIKKDPQLELLPPFALKVRPVENSDSNSTPRIRKSGIDPPLVDQLKPLTTDELKKRIGDMEISLDTTVDAVDTKLFENEEHSNYQGFTSLALTRQQYLHQALVLYNRIGLRKEVACKGRLVPESITQALLDILTSLRWQVPNDRKHLSAERYLVLPTNITTDRFYGNLRKACKDLMQWTDPSYFYSGIAVTKNFVSSPHIDDLDQSYQYAISLGDFKGGELCVEGKKYNEENDAFEDYVNVIETRNRIARVDGRHVHWVRTWEGAGDRYSLIFYDTTDRFQTPIIEEGVCFDYLFNTETDKGSTTFINPC